MAYVLTARRWPTIEKAIGLAVGCAAKQGPGCVWHQNSPNSLMNTWRLGGMLLQKENRNERVQHTRQCGRKAAMIKQQSDDSTPARLSKILNSWRDGFR